MVCCKKPLNLLFLWKLFSSQYRQKTWSCWDRITVPGFNSRGEVVTLRDFCDHIQVKTIVPISGASSGKCPGAYLECSVLPLLLPIVRRFTSSLAGRVAFSVQSALNVYTVFGFPVIHPASSVNKHKDDFHPVFHIQRLYGMSPFYPSAIFLISQYSVQ